MSDLITRAQYMADSKNMFAAYYLQFATEETYQLVRNRIGIKRIKESTDPNLNDIPLKEWDAVSNLVKRTIDQRKKGQAEGFPAGKFGWSLSDGVCIAKAVARDMIKD